jgi:hypothetical protein
MHGENLTPRRRNWKKMEKYRKVERQVLREVSLGVRFQWMFSISRTTENGNLATITLTPLRKCVWMIPGSSPCTQYFQMYRRGEDEHLEGGSMVNIFWMIKNSNLQTLLPYSQKILSDDSQTKSMHPPTAEIITVGCINVYLEGDEWSISEPLRMATYRNFPRFASKNAFGWAPGQVGRCNGFRDTASPLPAGKDMTNGAGGLGVRAKTVSNRGLLWHFRPNTSKVRSRSLKCLTERGRPCRS